MKKYANIVFLQGEEANEPLEILDNKGNKSAMKYLLQWDNGEYYDMQDKPSAGTSDRTYKKHDLILTWNARLNYIGLERIINQ